MALKIKIGFSYNPILESKINALKFDYVAMGHIHKTNFDANKKIVYSGSTISFGFDELGEHGMIVGEIENKDVRLEFVELDERLFTKYELNVENLFEKEEIVEKINNLDLIEQDMYEIVLVGNREIEINARDILKLIEKKNVLKVKDCTKLKYDIEEIAKENNLRGIFVREIIKKYDEGLYTEEQIEKAIEIGLEAM